MKYLDTNVDSADGTLVKYKWGDSIQDGLVCSRMEIMLQ